MVTYNCPRCDYKTHIKTQLKRHLMRKAPCRIIKADVDRQWYIDHYLYGNKWGNILKMTPDILKMTPDILKMTPNILKMTPKIANIPKMTPEIANIPKMTPDESLKINSRFENIQKTTSDDSQSAPKIENALKANIEYTNLEESNQITDIQNITFRKIDGVYIKQYVCEYCDTELSKNSHLHRHYSTCKIKKKLAEVEKIKTQLKNEIDRLIKENSTLHERLSEAISKVGNNNNNIVLLNFGNERLDHLDLGKIKHLIEEKGPFGALPHIFSEIYLNDKVPENMTIRYPNRKYPKLEYHKDGKWITGDKKLIINKTTMKTFEVCGNAKSDKLELVKEDYINEVVATRKRIYNDMENQLLTFKINS
jgi:hypothetical protein